MSGWPSRIAIVGAGTMGVGIAHVVASAGIETVLADLTAERARQARDAAVDSIARLEAGGCAPAGAAEHVDRQLRAAESVGDAVATAELIFEVVVERPEVKHDVYAAIEAACDDAAVIATNTSSIPIGELASRLRVPARFLGVHWFVPALLVPCVEVIASPATDAAVLEDVVALLSRLGKTPVVVGDGSGFVANRIQFALFREAAAIVEAGIATAEQVDEVVRSSFGFRLPFFGPFAIADMAGLDVYQDIFATLERDLGPSFAPPAMLRDHVARGEFGVKTGRGFLDIPAERADELIDRRDRAYVALSALRRELG